MQVDDLVDDLHLYLKCYSSTVFFKYLGSKNQQPGLSIIETLVENGLIKMEIWVVSKKLIFRKKNPRDIYYK